MVGDRTVTVVSDVDGVSIINWESRGCIQCVGRRAILLAIQSLRMVKTLVWGEAGQTLMQRG